MIALQDQNEVIGVSCSCLRTPEGTANMTWQKKRRLMSREPFNPNHFPRPAAAPHRMAPLTIQTEWHTKSF